MLILDNIKNTKKRFFNNDVLALLLYSFYKIWDTNMNNGYAFRKIRFLTVRWNIFIRIVMAVKYYFFKYDNTKILRKKYGKAAQDTWK